MHILVPTTSFPNALNPTSGIFIRRMLAHLPADIQATVLTPGTTEGCESGACESEAGRIRVHAFRYSTNSWQVLAHQPGGLPALLRRQPIKSLVLMPFFSLSLLVNTLRWARKVDLIHAQWFFSGLIAGLAGRWAGVPVLTTLRGSDIHWARHSRLCRWLLKWCLHLNDSVVTVGQDMAGQVGRWFPDQKKKITVISNGVADIFRSLGRRPANGFRVCVIGNLVRSKQVDLILREFRAAAKHRDDMKLVVIGDGPEFTNLKRMAYNLGLIDRVRFSGRLDPAAVADELSYCHALVLASSSEGRSNVVAEAMTAGVPVIAGAIDGVRELIRHRETGLLFEPGNVRQLTDCMLTLLDNPGFARQLGDNARLRMRLGGYSWVQCAFEYARLYERFKKKTQEDTERTSGSMPQGNRAHGI